MIEEVDESQLRPIFDPASLRQSILDRTKGAFEKKFPMENDRVRLEVDSLNYGKKQHFGIADTKEALMGSKRLAVPLHGNVRLIDKKSGKVLDERKNHLIANVPYLTDRGTFINKGTEYVVVNQSRLRAGIYTRRKDNGELEAHVNVKPGTGAGMRMFMEPDTGVYRVRVGDSQIKLMPVLQRLGVTEQEMIRAWGPEIYEANKQAADPKAFGKFYDRLVGARGAAFLRRMAEEANGKDSQKQAAACCGDMEVDDDYDAFTAAMTEAMAESTPEAPEFIEIMERHGFKAEEDDGGGLSFAMIEKAARIVDMRQKIKCASVLHGALGGAAIGGAGGGLLSAIQAMRVNEYNDELQRRYGEFGLQAPEDRKKKVHWLRNILLGAGAGAVGGGLLTKNMRKQVVESGGETKDFDPGPAGNRPQPEPKPKVPEAEKPGWMPKKVVVDDTPRIPKPSEVIEEQVKLAPGATTSTRPASDIKRNLEIMKDPVSMGDRVNLEPINPAKGVAVSDEAERFFRVADPDNEDPFEHLGDYAPSQFKGNYGENIDAEIEKARRYGEEAGLDFDYELLDKPYPVYRIRDDLRKKYVNSPTLPSMAQYEYSMIDKPGPLKRKVLDSMPGWVAGEDGNYYDMGSYNSSVMINAGAPEENLLAPRMRLLDGSTAIAPGLKDSGNATLPLDFTNQRTPFTARGARNKSIPPWKAVHTPEEILDHELTHAWTKPYLIRVGDGGGDSGLGVENLGGQSAKGVTGHGTKPAEVVGWLSRLQHALYGSRGKRVESPEEAKQFFEEILSIPDDSEFEEKLNEFPFDVRRIFRHMRRIEKSPDVEDKDSDTFRNIIYKVMPALVSTFKPETMEQIGKTASAEPDLLVWGADPMVGFMAGELLTRTPHQKAADLIVPADKNDFKVNRRALNAQRRRANTNPTDKQKSKGNYRMGHVRINGLDITIENPEGSTRSGVASDGTVWRTLLKNDYGYVKGTKGKDGDHIDVFLGPDLDSEVVFIVDQDDNGNGEFDEHKCMVGFKNRAEARKAYLSNYQRSWNGLMDITPLTFDEFKWWCYNGDADKPMRDQQTPKIAADYEGWVGFDLDVLAKTGSAMKSTIIGGLGGAALGAGVSALDKFRKSRDDDPTNDEDSSHFLRNSLIGAGLGGAAGYGVGKLKDLVTGKPKPTKLTEEQVNDILSGNLSLVEAQHTYYTHLNPDNPAFAKNIADLGYHKDQGAVMVGDVWNASDAVDSPTPLHGYTYRSLPYQAMGEDGLGFAVIASPTRPDLPSYITPVPNAMGSIVGMSSRPTWRVKDPSFLEKILGKEQLTDDDLSPYNPEVLGALEDIIEGFQLSTQKSGEYESHVAFDLDGTLAKNEGEFDPDSVGEPIESMVQLAQELRNEGVIIKVMTARAADPKNISVVEDWLAENGLGDTEVTNEKDPGMRCLFDDRVVEVMENEGLPVRERKKHLEELKKEAEWKMEDQTFPAYWLDSSELAQIIGDQKEAVIKHEGDKWKLYTKDGKRVLGTHENAQDAYKQEYAIEKSEERQKKKASEYKLYYFEGRNTGIAATSAAEAKKKKKRGGDKIVKVRTPSESEKRDMAAGRWVRTRADGKPPGKSSVEGKGYGPALKKKSAADLLTVPDSGSIDYEMAPLVGEDGSMQLQKFHAAKDGKMVGEVFARIEPGVDHVQVQNLYVDPQHRGNGVARSLMEKVINAYGQDRELQLRARPGHVIPGAPKQDDLVRFYESMGFATFDDEGRMKRPATTPPAPQKIAAADLLHPKSEKISDFDIGELSLKVAANLKLGEAGVAQHTAPSREGLDDKLSDEEKADLVLQQLTRMEIDPEISMRNLGSEYGNLGVKPLLDTSRKLLQINRGEAMPDDRDHKANQTYHSADDFLEERITKDAGRIGRTLLGRAGYQGSLKYLKPGHFTPQLDGLIVSNSLSQAVPGINPIELMDIQEKITQTGEGGIPSKDAIPMEARNVHVSQLGLIDPIRTAESGMVGVDQRLSSFVRKGPNNQVYMPMIDRRTGKRVWRTPSQLYGKTILFPRRVPSQIIRV